MAESSASFEAARILTPGTLVAHRGWPAQFPENSLAGYQHAVARGARWLETDLQIADDGECWLFHDVHLERLCRTPGTIFELDRDGTGVEVWGGTPSAQRNAPLPLARLSQLVQLMKTCPQTSWFWELKPESVARHGNRKCFEVLSEWLDKVGDQVVVISFELTTLSFFRRHASVKLGAVVREPDAQLLSDFAQLEPEFLFCDQAYWSPESVVRWAGEWSMAVYTINDLGTANIYCRHGADLIETDDIGGLIDACRDARSG